MTPTEIASLEALAKAATRRDRGWLKSAAEESGYWADENGAVYSRSNWRGYGTRTLVAFPNFHGYPCVKLNLDGRAKKIAVHRLVAAFHLPPPAEAQTQIRHLNGNKSDNRAANLLWGTASENAQDRIAHGTDRAAENGRVSAEKLRGRRREFCFRGHFKEGRKGCEECRRMKRRGLL